MHPPGYASPAEGLGDLLTSKGGCVGAKEALGMLGQEFPPNSDFETLVRTGTLIGYADVTSRRLHLPVWQFAPGGGLLPAIREVLTVLQSSTSYESLTPFVFFLQHNPLTYNSTPLDALRAGNVARVIQAAIEYSR